MLGLEFNLLFDIGIILIVGTILAYILKKLKQPPLIAYILAGVLLGPIGFSLITSQEDILLLAELGIAFLLFIAGIELDIDRLKRAGVPSVLVGVIQTGVAFLIGNLIARFFGYPFSSAIFIGLAVSFSSTMIVVKILSERKKLNSLTGRLSLGILLVEDIIIIVALSLLSSWTGTSSLQGISQIVVNGAGLVAIAIVMSKYILPKALEFAADTREIFFLASVTTCFFFIGLASALGFSIAIGGFIAGLALATHPYNVEISARMDSLKDFFTVIFFASLGMQLYPHVIVKEIWLVISLLSVLFIVKPIVMSSVLSYLGYGTRVPIKTGIGLAQGSEFVFILASQGLVLNAITQETYSVMISVILFSIAVTPYSFKFANKIANYFMKKFPRGLLRRKRIDELEKEKKNLKNHIILIGCDVMGRSILDEIGHGNVLVIDHDPEEVEELREEGYKAIYGEADCEMIISELNVEKAKMVVETVPNFEESLYILRKVKKMNEDLLVVNTAVRVDDALRLYEEGSDLVLVPTEVAGEKASADIKKILKGKNLKEKEIQNLKQLEAETYEII